jgi:hypothetical protein
MPRLVGKRSNTDLYVGLISAVLAVSSAAIAMEYFGIINEVPNFGKEESLLGRTAQPARSAN